ncbi:MAG: cytochrome C [Minwuia sp.]|nr:cytochrome C [Minwuia sp.]
MIRSIAVAVCLTVFVSGPAAAGDVTEAAVLALSCAACHGPGGASPGSIPAIDRLTPSEIVAALRAFRSGTRPATVMDRIAKGYSDAEIAQLSGQFGKGR